MSHLSALELRLSNERRYLSLAKSEAERDLREVRIKQMEKEIAGERAFVVSTDLGDDALLAELGL